MSNKLPRPERGNLFLRPDFPDLLLIRREFFRAGTEHPQTHDAHCGVSHGYGALVRYYYRVDSRHLQSGDGFPGFCTRLTGIRYSHSMPRFVTRSGQG